MSVAYDDRKTDREDRRRRLLEQARGLSIVDYCNRHVAWDRKKSRGGDWWACCPMHQEKSASFHVQDNASGKNGRKGRFHCFGCGVGGDIVDLCRLIEGVSLDAALETLTGEAIKAAPVFDESQREDIPDLEKRARGLAIWQEGQPIAGTLAETYLRTARAIAADLSHADLRFHPRAPFWGYVPEKSKKWAPALLAAIRKPDGEFIGVHVTYLAADGLRKAALTPARKIFGQKNGGFIRLAPLSERMVVGEGIESALSASDVSGRPALAAVTSENLAKLKPIAAVRDWLVAYDTDAKDQGFIAAKAFAVQVIKHGAKAHRFPAPAPHKDWNDMAMASAQHPTV